MHPIIKLALVPPLLCIGFMMMPFIIFLSPWIISIVAVIYFRPDLVFRLYTRFSMWHIGFRSSSVTLGHFKFAYAERGKLHPTRPSMLFLHGFSAAKDMWWPFIKHLPKDWHIIAVDLPGHGGTTRKMSDSFTLQAQAARIRQTVGLRKRPFHLVGISMGGGVAGVYAAKYLEDLVKLTLFCPAGIRSSIPSDFELATSDGRLPNATRGMLPETHEEYSKLLPFLMHEAPKVPSLYWKGMRLLRKNSNKFYNKVLTDMMGQNSKDCLRSNMAGITIPTLVLWGQHDKLLHPSGATVLKEGIPKSQVHLLERCGHSLHMERPYKTSKLLIAFAEEG